MSLRLNLSLGAANLAPLIAAPVGMINFNEADFTKWQTAVARVKAGTGRAKVVAIGESVTRGEYAGDTGQWDNAKANSWPSKLAAYLSSLGLATTAQDIFNSGGNAGVVPMSALRNVYHPGFNAAASWAQSASTGFGGCLLVNNADAGVLSFTPTGNVDTFELWDITHTTASSVITYNIDGGAETQLTQTAGAFARRKTIISAGAPGAHTINIARVSGTAFFVGIRAWNSQVPAVDFINGGRGGGTALLLANTAATFAYRSHMADICSDADLVIFPLQINDEIANTAEATFKANMQLIINDAKAGGASFCMMTGNPVNVANADATRQATFRQYLRDIRATNNCGLIDLYSIYVSFAAMQTAGLATNPLHPNKNFYADLVTNHMGPIIAEMGAV